MLQRECGVHATTVAYSGAAPQPQVTKAGAGLQNAMLQYVTTCMSPQTLPRKHLAVKFGGSEQSQEGKHRTCQKGAQAVDMSL